MLTAASPRTIEMRRVPMLTVMVLTAMTLILRPLPTIKHALPLPTKNSTSRHSFAVIWVYQCPIKDSYSAAGVPDVEFPDAAGRNSKGTANFSGNKIAAQCRVIYNDSTFDVASFEYSR